MICISIRSSSLFPGAAGWIRRNRALVSDDAEKTFESLFSLLLRLHYKGDSSASMFIFRAVMQLLEERLVLCGQGFSDGGY